MRPLGDGADADKPAEDRPLDSIREMYAALRACWVPRQAPHGMEYTVRFAFKRDGEVVAPPRVTYASHDAPSQTRDIHGDAVNEALIHLRQAGAVVRRPIAIRFVDNRSSETSKAIQ